MYRGEHVRARTSRRDYRDALRAEGWTVAECATRLGVTRNTLSRVRNGKAGVSPWLALALKRIGWSDAGHWVRMQGAYELALARRTGSAA